MKVVTIGLLVLAGVVVSVRCRQEGGGEEPREVLTEERGGKVERVKCGERKELGAGEKVVLASPRYPKRYPNRKACTWDVAAKEPGSTLQVDCPIFHIPWAKGCKGDYLLLKDGNGKVKKLCGHGKKQYTTQTSELKATFKSNNKKNGKGFRCTVRSVRSSGLNCDCGVANIEQRIVGGQEVSPRNRYPWHVGFKQKKDADADYLCGGSIINDRFILTAAHCFYDDDGNPEFNLKFVVGVGDHNMASTEDDVEGVTKLVDVEKVIMHENYKYPSYDYDIALLRLSEPLDISSHAEVSSVCLPSSADASKTYVNEKAVATGWGALKDNGSRPDELMEVEVLIQKPGCDGKDDITDRMLCAGYKAGGKDTCKGDSGGPLSVVEDDLYVQVGIVSWGNGCAEPNSPGVYARVTEFLPWIGKKTKDANYCQ